MNEPKKRLLDQVRDRLRLKHHSIRTEYSYISWIKRYILFHNKRHPQEMGTEVLNMDLDDQINAVRAKTTVMSKDETLRVIRALDGVHRLMAILLYGTGLRLMECVRLRVKDVNFSVNQITVRDGKGARDRATLLPEDVKPALKDHLQKVKLLHQDDLAKG
jgi:integrase